MAELNSELPAANVNPQATANNYIPFEYNGVSASMRVDNPTHPLDTNLIHSLMSQRMPSSMAGEQQAIFNALMNRSRARRLGAYQASLVEPTINKISELQKMTAQKGAEMETSQMKMTNIARLADAIAKDPSANNRNMYAAFAKMYGGALDPMNAGVLQGSDLYKLKREDEKFNLEKDLYKAKKGLIDAQTAESAARAEAYRSGGGGGGRGGGGRSGGGRSGGGSSGLKFSDFDTFKKQLEDIRQNAKSQISQIRGAGLTDQEADEKLRKINSDVTRELTYLSGVAGGDKSLQAMIGETANEVLEGTNAYGAFGKYAYDS